MVHWGNKLVYIANKIWRLIAFKSFYYHPLVYRTAPKMSFPCIKYISIFLGNLANTGQGGGICNCTTFHPSGVEIHLSHVRWHKWVQISHCICSGGELRKGMSWWASKIIGTNLKIYEKQPVRKLMKQETKKAWNASNYISYHFKFLFPVSFIKVSWICTSWYKCSWIN